jgi:hypothetical protein
MEELQLHEIIQEIFVPILVAGRLQCLLREKIVISMLLLPLQFLSFLHHSGLFFLLQ